MRGGIEFTETLQGPEGMDGADVGRLGRQFAKGRSEVLLLTFDDEALGAEAAVLRAAGKTSDKVCGGIALRGLSDRAGLIPDDAVNASARVVAQVVSCAPPTPPLAS